MTRYLETLIAQARGAEPEIRPRLRSRFEPDVAGAAEISESSVLNERVATSEPTAPHTASAVPSVTTHKPVEPRPGRSVTEVKHEIVHHVKQQTERIEHVEHRVIEKISAAPAIISATSPESAVIVEHPGRQPSANGRIAAAEFRQPVPTATVADPFQPQAVQVEPAPVRAEKTAQGADDIASSLRVAAARVAAEADHARRDASAVQTLDSAPEITISIGVLDIRLTQEAAAERRPSPRAPERRDAPMPLADYLAKRSGGAS